MAAARLSIVVLLVAALVSSGMVALRPVEAAVLARVRLCHGPSAVPHRDRRCSRVGVRAVVGRGVSVGVGVETDI